MCVLRVKLIMRYKPNAG